MRKFLFFLLVLCLLSTLVFTGCKASVDQPDIDQMLVADAESKIAFYYQSAASGDSGLLQQLGLMTRAEADALFDQPLKALPNKVLYLETGISYKAFENACNEYISKEYFNKMNFSCFDVLDGQLIYLIDEQAEGFYSNPRDIKVVDADDKQASYLVTVDYADPDEKTHTRRERVTFVLENGRFVIDNVTAENEKATMAEALSLLWQGMLGIFIIAAVIIASAWLLGVISKKKKSN